MGASKRGVSLDPLDEQYLMREVVGKYGLTFSGALRFAIRDWRIMRGEDADYDVKLAGRIARTLGGGSARRFLEEHTPTPEA